MGFNLNVTSKTFSKSNTPKKASFFLRQLQAGFKIAAKKTKVSMMSKHFLLNIDPEKGNNQSVNTDHSLQI